MIRSENMKQKIAFLLVIVLLFGFAGCASSKKAPEAAESAEPAAATPAVVTETPAATPASEASELDGTYWCWGRGVSVGHAYWVQFHADGTMDTLNIGYDNPDDIISVPYTYENGVLTIGASSLDPEPSTYHRLADGSFESEALYGMQGGYARRSFTPDEYQNYAKVETLDSLYRSVLMKGVWYHPDPMNLDATRTVFLDGYRADRYSVSFEQDQNYEHVVSYSYFPIRTDNVYFQFFEEKIDNMTYDPELDVLYYTSRNDVSGDVIVEYLIHYDSDPDIDTLMRDYQYYTSTEMTIRPQN